MNLLERLKSGFSEDTAANANPEHDVPPKDIQVAAAVLLLEMEHADHAHDPQERAEIARQLQDYFDLDDDEAATLITAAEPQAEESVSLHRFLQALNQQLDYAQKRQVLEMLWHVAYADQNLDAQEEGLLREFAELLHLPHREFIKSKLVVTAQK